MLIEPLHECKDHDHVHEQCRQAWPIHVYFCMDIVLIMHTAVIFTMYGIVTFPWYFEYIL